MKVIVFLAALFSVFSIPGAHAETDFTDLSSLRNRVASFWGAKVKQDWNAVYALTSQEFKDEIDEESFVNRSNIHVVSYEIGDFEIDPQNKESIVPIRYTVQEKGYVFSFSARERWIWEDGNWHADLSPPRNPMAPK
jgi:hypothetical protein